MKSFKTNWTDEIAEITTRSEFQNCTVRIERNEPDVQGEYDIDTGKWTYPSGADPVIYEGRARIQPIRWGVFAGGESQARSRVVTSITIQLPKNTIGPTRLGYKLKVVSADDAEVYLKNQWYNITEGNQAGAQASRTLEASVDGDPTDEQ